MIEAPSELPLVRLDAVQIEQVLTNLLENAAKYSPPGTPITVRSCVAADSDTTARLLITVADRGPGIEPSEQERIFEKFYRLTDATRPVGGTGMGLAIVKGLVDAHGGRVTLESAPGRGSTFTVGLPMEQAEALIALSSPEERPA